MKIIKQSLTTFFNCCFPNKSNNLYPNGTTNSISSFWENNSKEYIPLVNIAPDPGSLSKSINTMGLNNGTTPSLNREFLVGEGFDSIFLINKPSTYSSMLDSFINYHGPNSEQVKGLISPEMDLADRAFNIHTITGNNTQPILLNTLKNKSSLSKLLDTPISSNTSVSPTSIEQTTSMDLSMIGVDRFLQDYSEGVKIALDLLS
jgi:hypothetical protein